MSNTVLTSKSKHIHPDKWSLRNFWQSLLLRLRWLVCSIWFSPYCHIQMTSAPIPHPVKRFVNTNKKKGSDNLTMAFLTVSNGTLRRSRAPLPQIFAFRLNPAPGIQSFGMMKCQNHWQVINNDPYVNLPGTYFNDGTNSTKNLPEACTTGRRGLMAVWTRLM